MISEFKKTYTITTNLLDSNDNLKLSGFFDVVQSIAGEHASVIGCGYYDMISQDKIWVIARHYVKFLKPIRDPGKIDVLTYPLRPRIIDYGRENEFSVNGEVFAHSISSWMVYNIKKDAIDKCNELDNLEYHEPYFKERIKKLSRLNKSELDFVKTVTVLHSMIDHNKHMNNTHYFDFFLDIFGDEKVVESAQIEYIKQVYLGDNIDLYKHNDENYDELYGYIGENLIFQLRISYFKE